MFVRHAKRPGEPTPLGLLAQIYETPDRLRAAVVPLCTQQPAGCSRSAVHVPVRVPRLGAAPLSLVPRPAPGVALEPLSEVMGHGHAIPHTHMHISRIATSEHRPQSRLMMSGPLYGSCMTIVSSSSV